MNSKTPSQSAGGLDAEVLDALEVDGAGRVTSGAGGDGGVEGGLGFVPALGLKVAKAFFEGGHKSRHVGGQGALADDLINPHGLFFALHSHGVEDAAVDHVVGGGVGRLADDDVGAVVLVGALEARAQVHVVAEQGVVAHALRAHEAHPHQP